MPVASLVVRIAADIADFEKNIAGVERTLLRTGRNLENIGSRMTKGITLPLVAAVGIAAKAAIDFESSFAGVRKTVDATETQFKELEGQFRDLAKTMPLSVNEINKVAESAGQLGVKIGDISAFTQTMIKMGTATNLTADEAATAMARFANALGQPQINMEKLGSAIVKLGQEGASTEKEIIDMSLRMAGAGAQIGLSAGSVLGMANALSSVGIEADKGGSAISRLFNDLNSAVSQGGTTLRDFAAVAGLTAEAFGKLFKEDSASAITKFIEGLHAQKAAGTDLLKVLDDLGISELRYRDTVLLAANAGPEFAKSIRTGNTAFAEGKALQDEYNERLKTTESQLKILKGNLLDVAIAFGQAFLPIINQAVTAAKPLVQHLADMATAFKELPEPIRNITFGMVALLASLGPIIFIVGKVQQAFAGILGVVRFFIPAMAITGTSVTGLGVSFTGLLGTLGRFAGPIALVVSGLFAVKQAMDAFERSTTEGLKTLGSAIPAFGLVTRAVDALKSAFPALGGVFDDVATIIKNSLIIAFERLKGAFGIVKDSLIRTAEVIRDSIKPLFDALGVDMERLATVMRNTVIPAVAAVAAAFITAIPGVRGLLELIAILPGFKDVAAALDRVAASTGRAADEARGFKSTFASLDGAFKDGKFSIDAWRGSLLKTDDGFTVAKEGMITFGSGVNTHVVKPLKLGGEEIDKAGKKLKEYAESVKDLSDELSGVKLAGDVTKLADAFRLLTDEQKQAPDIMLRVGDAAERLRQDGAKLSPELLTLAVRTEAFSDWLNKVPGQTDLWATSFHNLRTALQTPLVQLRDVNEALMDIARQQVITPIVGIPDNMWSVIGQGRDVPIPDIPLPNLKLFGQEFGQQLGNIIGNAFRGGSVRSAVEDGASLVGSTLLSGLATKLTTGANAITGWLGGMISTALPLVGSLLGPLVGKIADAFNSLFGNRGRDLVKDFAASFGGFDVLHVRLLELGSAGEQLWVRLTQGVGRNNPQQAQAAIDAITAALGRQQAELEALGARIGDLADIAAGSGQLLDVSMVPFINQLRTAGAITDDVAAKLLSLTTDNSASWQHMQGLAEKYGIELDSLGQRFQQQKLSETAGDIIRDFNILIANGADFNAVLHGMTDEIQGVVLQSLKFGTEIPDNMKPWITELIATGRLLDATGTKITDIDTLKFGPAVKSDVDKLVDAIKELIAAIGTKLPAALTGLAATRFPAIRIPVEFDLDPLPGGGNPSLPSYGSGGVVRKPTLALVGEVPEAIIPLNQLGSFSPASGGTTIIFEQDGRKSAEFIVPHIPGVVRRYGLV